MRIFRLCRETRSPLEITYINRDNPSNLDEKIVENSIPFRISKILERQQKPAFKPPLNKTFQTRAHLFEAPPKKNLVFPRVQRTSTHIHSSISLSTQEATREKNEAKRSSIKIGGGGEGGRERKKKKKREEKKEKKHSNPSSSSRIMAARRGTRRRYLIYPRFRYQSPTKGDATTRRASATRSHEPSRGTKLLFSVSLLSTSTGARSRSSLSLSLLSAVASPSLSLSSIRSRECHVSPLPLPTSLQPTRSCPTALHAPSTSAHAPTGTHTHTHTHT